MTMFTKIFASAAVIAALATAAPAAAQYYSYAPRYASPYGAPYGNAYGYNANVTNMAAQQCAAAVQSRLNRSVGMTGILGAVLGARQPSGRVLQVTQVSPNRRSMTVRGLANSGRAYAYSPYGYGAYGAIGYNYRPDLSFRCSVDYRGYIRDVDINRR
jgi:hypothetical protein